MVMSQIQIQHIINMGFSTNFINLSDCVKLFDADNIAQVQFFNSLSFCIKIFDGFISY